MSCLRVLGSSAQQCVPVGARALFARLQFEPLVKGQLEQGKAPIAKQLRDLVKLSKWDLSNYWSLKECSDKSHRKLHKLSKDWDAVLRTPFHATALAEERKDTQPLDEEVHFGPALQPAPPARLAPAALVLAARPPSVDAPEPRLAQVAARARRLLQRSALASAFTGGREVCREAVDGFAVALIERVAALRAATAAAAAAPVAGAQAADGDDDGGADSVAPAAARTSWRAGEKGLRQQHSAEAAAARARSHIVYVGARSRVSVSMELCAHGVQLGSPDAICVCLHTGTKRRLWLTR